MKTYNVFDHNGDILSVVTADNETTARIAANRDWEDDKIHAIVAIQSLDAIVAKINPDAAREAVALAMIRMGSSDSWGTDMIEIACAPMLDIAKNADLPSFSTYSLEAFEFWQSVDA